MFTRSLMDGDNANFWEDIELRIDPDPLCTSCYISFMNKKARSKNPLNPKAPFKWVFVDTIPATAPKRFTINNSFSNYLLIIDAYSKIPKLYCMDKITTEEVMGDPDMIQSRSRKIDEFGWCDTERISADAGTQFTSTYFQEIFQTRGVRLTLADP